MGVRGLGWPALRGLGFGAGFTPPAAPTISGTVTIGGTLTGSARASGVTSQWQRGATFGGGGSWANIGGETAANYTVAVADIGYSLRRLDTNTAGSTGSNTLIYAPEDVTAVRRVWKIYSLTPGSISSIACAKTGATITQATGSLQPVASATSFPGSKPGLTFDGTDDVLASGNLDFSADQKQRVVMALQVITDPGAAKVIAEFSVASYTLGDWQVGVKFDGATATSLGADANGGDATFGIVRTATGHHPAAGAYVSFCPDTTQTNGCSFIRENGSALALTNVATGCIAGNFASAGQLYLGGARGGSYCNFCIGSALIIMSGNAQDGDLADAEAYCKNGAGL